MIQMQSRIQRKPFSLYSLKPIETKAADAEIMAGAASVPLFNELVHGDRLDRMLLLSADSDGAIEGSPEGPYKSKLGLGNKSRLERFKKGEGMNRERRYAANVFMTLTH